MSREERWHEWKDYVRTIQRKLAEQAFRELDAAFMEEPERDKEKVPNAGPRPSADEVNEVFRKMLEQLEDTDHE